MADTSHLPKVLKEKNPRAGILEKMLPQVTDKKPARGNLIRCHPRGMTWLTCPMSKQQRAQGIRLADFSKIAPTSARGFHLPVHEAVCRWSSVADTEGSLCTSHCRPKSCGGRVAPKEMRDSKGTVNRSLPTRSANNHPWSKGPLP